MKKNVLLFPFVALLAFAQTSSHPGGSGGGSGISGLTTGKVPVATSATTVGNSACLSESGGNAVSFGSCSATTGVTVFDSVLGLNSQGLATIVNPPIAASGFGNVYPGFVERIWSNGYIPENYANSIGRLTSFTVWNGHNSADNTDKKTDSTLYLQGNFPASGQRFGILNTMNSHGAGDSFAVSNNIYCSGYPNASGDEGCGVDNASVFQESTLYTTTISSVVQTACNTTLSADAAKSTSPTDYIAMSVGSTTGCTVGDWITVGQGVFESTDTAMEVVQIHAVGGGTISAILQSAHVSGATVTPAVNMVLAVMNTNLGQDRIWVNLSGPSYSTGTIASVSGTAVVGSGTTWVTNMVGGNSNLVGCIAFTADNVTTSPFNGGSPLVSWFPIQSRTNNTNLVLARSYTGVAPTGSAAYIIRPCARAKYFQVDSTTSTSSVSHVLLASNSMAWNAGNTVEQAISPYTQVQHARLTASYFNGPGIFGAMNELVNHNTFTPYTYALRITNGELTSAGKDEYIYGVDVEAQTRECVLCAGGKNSNGVGISLTTYSGDNKKIHWSSGGNVFSNFSTASLTLENDSTNQSPRVEFVESAGGINQGSFSFTGEADFNEVSSAPPNPASGKLRLYAKTDHAYHVVDSSGTDTALGAGGGGGMAIGGAISGGANAGWGLFVGTGPVLAQTPGIIVNEASGYLAQVTIYNNGNLTFLDGGGTGRHVIELSTNDLYLGSASLGNVTLQSGTGKTLTFTNIVTPASTGTRYLCISTSGLVTSSASACSGT